MTENQAIQFLLAQTEATLLKLTRPPRESGQRPSVTLKLQRGTNITTATIEVDRLRKFDRDDPAGIINQIKSSLAR